MFFFCLTVVSQNLDSVPVHYSEWKVQNQSAKKKTLYYYFFLILQASYIKNLLQITKYLPDLRSKILELVIDNLITIDVSEHFLIMSSCLYANITNFLQYIVLLSLLDMQTSLGH